jgi:hypothetical protein
LAFECLRIGKRRKKRGGPYSGWTAEQEQFMVQAPIKMRVSDEEFANGTGFMQLYNLQGGLKTLLEQCPKQCFGTIV